MDELLEGAFEDHLLTIQVKTPYLERMVHLFPQGDAVSKADVRLELQVMVTLIDMGNKLPPGLKVFLTKVEKDIGKHLHSQYKKFNPEGSNLKKFMDRTLPVN